MRTDVPLSDPKSSDPARATTSRRRDYVRRTSLQGWLAEGTQLVFIGEPGSGKSTLLRCVALDLLTEQGTFEQISRRWAGLLPIHVSFSQWTRLSVTLGHVPGLKNVVSQTLQQVLTADLISLLDRALDERRVLLLLDGLDEWSDEQAARTTLQHALAFVETHSLPTLATARPRGLEKIGPNLPGWRIAELAGLSAEQQRAVADIWFGTELRGEGTDPRVDLQRLIQARRDRFFTELSRDRRMLALASNPLLLVGLVALSLRQIALPRNRTQVVEDLIQLLIETHPARRATAAGDTQQRFQHIPDHEERRAALARLAFTARSASGGGTYDLKAARQAIRDYLTDPNTYAYPMERAQKAASEMLAVNAETLGLLAERAPGEVGFVHAVFEEHLAAEHIHSWALEDTLAFVRRHRCDPLWRNVVSSLAAQLPRPTEVQTLITAIEEGDIDHADAISRDLLLAEIAFSSARKPPALEKRLLDRAYAQIEHGNWMPARREILKTALAGPAELTPHGTSNARLASWAPRRGPFPWGLFDQFAAWRPSPDLLEVLLGGLHDEEHSTQQSAARTLSRHYAGDPEIASRLIATLRSTVDLSVVTAVLEALTLGWPDTPQLPAMHDAAATSRDLNLQLTGIWARLSQGRVRTDDRDTLVELLPVLGGLDYRSRHIARALLYQYWPNDPELIAIALKAVEPRSSLERKQFESEAAQHYLLRCSPTNAAVADWVRHDIEKDRSSVFIYQGYLLTPFALAHPDIRASIVRRIQSDRDWLHPSPQLLVQLAGDDVRDALIQFAREASNYSLPRAVQPLLERWGRSDRLVATLLDDIATWNDERLNELASLLPRILTDSAACRNRLLSLVRLPHARVQLIAEGFSLSGCTADDTEVVDSLLATVGKGAPAFHARAQILVHFSRNLRVRQLALDSLQDREPPLQALAQVYEDDPQIRRRILACAKSLPTPLRGHLVEAACEDPEGCPEYADLLNSYHHEVDGELQIAASISYHRRLAQKPALVSKEHLQRLTHTLRSRSLDHYAQGAAAFAGLLLLGRVHDFVAMEKYPNKPLPIHTGGAIAELSDSLMSLICERWEDVVGAFGTTFASRFGDNGAKEAEMWEHLAPHINASPAARRDFLAFCTQTPATFGVRSLAALAREQPASALLLDHCWHALFESEDTGRFDRRVPWTVRQRRLEMAYVLRDHFRDRPHVVERMRQAFNSSPSTVELVALTLLAPSDPLLRSFRPPAPETDPPFSHWVAATHLASVRSEPEEFVKVVLDMINHHSHGIWDFQNISNRAVVARLRCDPLSVQRIKERLACNPTENEVASLPRLLAHAGQMDAETQALCRSLLAKEAAYPLPRAGYDVVEDSIRAVSASLLEVLAPSFAP